MSTNRPFFSVLEYAMPWALSRDLSATTVKLALSKDWASIVRR